MDGFLKVRSSCVLREAHQGSEKMPEKNPVFLRKAPVTSVQKLRCPCSVVLVTMLITQYQNSETKYPSIIPKSLKIVLERIRWETV